MKIKQKATQNTLVTMFKALEYASIFDKIPDDLRQFPEGINALLKHLRLPREILVNQKESDYSRKNNSDNILDFLFELGRGNLSAARIIEGHINALLLIETFGTKSQKTKYFKHANEGSLFGIWNTEIVQERVKIRKKGDLSILTGAKNFCTGALNLQFAIVTAHRAKKTQMVIIDINENSHLQEDWSYWNPNGMKSSVSCRIDFSDTLIRRDQFLGEPQDYYQEPYFSWGAVRFSAVQFGGAQAIFDIVLKDLKKRKRVADPYQKMRLGKMAVLMQTAELWISRAAKIQQQDVNENAIKIRVNFANMMRSAALEICEEIISIAEKAVGVQGTMTQHALEQPVRDLRVYLKQAGPDAALASVGHFIAKRKKQTDVS